MGIRLKKMGTPVENKDSMIHIMKKLPSAYDSLIQNFEDRLDSALEPLAMGVLRHKLSQQYEKIKRRNGPKTNKSNHEVDCWEKHDRPGKFRHRTTRQLRK